MKRIVFVASDQDRAESYPTLKAKFADRFIRFSGPYTADVADDFTAQEEKQFLDIIAKRDTLDSWESSKLRNLTLAQLNNEVASLDSEIDAITNLTQAKTLLKKLLADDAKAWRIVLWLLKREMSELD